MARATRLDRSAALALMQAHSQCRRIDNISDRRRNGAGPVALVFGANGADQLDLWIGEKTNRIGSERNVRTIPLAIARGSIEQLAPLCRGLNAYPENLNFP